MRDGATITEKIMLHGLTNQRAGFGQLPVEFGSSTVGVSPTCAPAIDASGFNYVEMHAPIAAFADVPSYAVNVDGVDVELLLGHRFPPLFWSCQVFEISPGPGLLAAAIATISRGRALKGLGRKTLPTLR